VATFSELTRSVRSAIGFVLLRALPRGVWRPSQAEPQRALGLAEFVHSGLLFDRDLPSQVGDLVPARAYGARSAVTEPRDWRPTSKPSVLGSAQQNLRLVFPPSRFLLFPRSFGSLRGALPTIYDVEM